MVCDVMSSLAGKGGASYEYGQQWENHVGKTQ